MAKAERAAKAKERKEAKVEEKERHSKVDAGAVEARTSRQTAPLARARLLSPQPGNPGTLASRPTSRPPGRHGTPGFQREQARREARAARAEKVAKARVAKDSE